MDTEEITTLVFPLVHGMEPVHIPDKKMTVLGTHVSITNMVLKNIDFASATMGLGGTDNEIIFELLQMTALITNNWELSTALGYIDWKGSGHILVSQTSVSVTVRIGQDNLGELTINLDDSKFSIGGLQIVVDGDHAMLNLLISELERLLVPAIEAIFKVVVSEHFG